MKCTADLAGGVNDWYVESAMVADYKMGKWGLNDSYYDDSFKYQAEWYACCMYPDVRKFKILEFHFVFPFQEKSGGGNPIKTILIETADIPAIFEKLKAEILRVDEIVSKYRTKKQYKPNLAECSHCLFIESCDHAKMPEKFNMKALSKDNIIEATHKLEQMKALTKLAEGKIKEYIQEHGNIERDGVNYGFYQKEIQYVGEPAEVVHSLLSSKNGDKEGAENLKADIWKALNLSAFKLKRIGKKYNMEVSNLISTKTRKEFGQYE